MLVSIVWFTDEFRHHQLVPSMGNGDQKISHIHRFLEKKLHDTYLFDGNHHQQSRRRTATHCPGEVSPNPHSSSGTSHQAKS